MTEITKTNFSISISISDKFVERVHEQICTYKERTLKYPKTLIVSQSNAAYLFKFMSLQKQLEKEYGATLKFLDMDVIVTEKDDVIEVY